MINHISALRAALTAQHLDGFILPVNDEFMGEYVPDSARRLQWLTGFTGSAGLAIVLTAKGTRRSKEETPQAKAAFFTDGRYTLQAEAQVKDFELFNSGTLAPDAWLKEQAAMGAVIGYDPKLHTLRTLQRYQRNAPGLRFRAVDANPIDALWEGRPPAPDAAVQIHPLQFAGEEAAAKRRRMADEIGKLGADAAILTAPDSICWLLNIRGGDVPYTPFVLCYAILECGTGKVLLFLDPARVTPELAQHLGDAVEVHHPESLPQQLARFKNGSVLYDAQSSPAWFHQLLSDMKAKIVEGSDPCQFAKACKNAVELDGTRAAHTRDGLAVTRFLCWLDGAVQAGEALSEIRVAEKLESVRRAHGLYCGGSFATIAGSGPNGAIVHYHATDASDRALDKNSLLLLDSGGQYPDGTTDITRTIALGTPSAEMKDRFTRVLKGHIALARATFPEGTAGGQLDTLARQYLWEIGLDYDHGTGHGVGSYLSVHEGPQRISKRMGDVALQPGMILSNEPGYYKAGEYGIRIENLVVVKELEKKEGRRWFGFETLTLAPIDMRLVDDTLLTTDERTWLNEYHKRIHKTFVSELSTQELHWLAHYSVA